MFQTITFEERALTDGLDARWKDQLLDPRRTKAVIFQDPQALVESDGDDLLLAERVLGNGSGRAWKRVCLTLASAYDLVHVPARQHLIDDNVLPIRCR